MSAKLLCAVDENSEAAVTLASNLASAIGAELILLAVNERTGGASGTSGVTSHAWDETQLKSLLKRVASLAKKAGVTSAKVTSVESRDVARAIVVYAEDNGVDHIVVGTGGKGLAARLMQGSVSRDVVLRAHCPVTVAR